MGISLLFISGIGLLGINTKIFSDDLMYGTTTFRVFGWFVSKTFLIGLVIWFGKNALLISIFSKPGELNKWIIYSGFSVIICGLLTIISFLAHALHTYGTWLFLAGLFWLILLNLYGYKREIN